MNFLYNFTFLLTIICSFFALYFITALLLTDNLTRAYTNLSIMEWIILMLGFIIGFMNKKIQYHHLDLSTKRNIVFWVSTIIITFLNYRGMFSNYFQTEDFMWLFFSKESTYNIISIFNPVNNGFIRIIPRFIWYILYEFFGTNPFPYYIFSLIFHIGNVVVVYLITSSLFKDNLVKYFASFLFTIAEIHHNNIMWLSAMQEIIATLFILSTIYFLILYLENSRTIFIWFSRVTYIFALLTHEISAVLLFLIILTYFIFKKKSIVSLNIFIPFFLFSVLHAITIIYIQSKQTFIGSNYIFSLDSIYNLLQSIQVLIYESIGLEIPVLLELIVLILLIIWSFYRNKKLFFLVLFSIATLVPYSFFTFPIFNVRFYYLTSVGFFILIAYLIYSGYKSRWQLLSIIFITLIVFFNLFQLTRDYNYYRYSCNSTKYAARVIEHSLRKNPKLQKEILIKNLKVSDVLSEDVLNYIISFYSDKDKQ